MDPGIEVLHINGWWSERCGREVTDGYWPARDGGTGLERETGPTTGYVHPS